MKLKTEMSRYLKIVEDALDEVLPREEERPTALSQAMRHAVGTGGKRIRPVICLAACEAAGGKAEDARYPAAAIELMHNYTLVHDDLPAMDGDELRRGAPSVWKKFGEANAVLAGDALQALAFQVAARTPQNATSIVRVLGAKGVGVVRGQVEDVAREKDGAKLSPLDIAYIYEHKTADLFIAAAAMGAFAANASDEDVEKLRVFAIKLGLAFQLEDDLLDGDSPYSPEETKAHIAELTAAAVSVIAGLPGDTSFLMALAESLISREV